VKLLVDLAGLLDVVFAGVLSCDKLLDVGGLHELVSQFLYIITSASLYCAYIFATNSVVWLLCRKGLISRECTCRDVSRWYRTLASLSRRPMWRAFSPISNFINAKRTAREVTL
jgi:hypothetical protein